MMKAVAVGERWSWIRLLVALGVWLVTYFVARALLKNGQMETWLRVLVAIGPLPFFAVCLWLVIQGVRSLDELERKIQLEALAMAYTITIFLLMTLGLMQRAVELKFEDWSYAHVWAYVTALYPVCVGFAARRYR
jgi:hypothetical protein